MEFDLLLNNYLSKKPVEVDYASNFGDNRCWICNKPYPHRRVKNVDNVTGLCVIDIRTSHANCVNIYKKIEKNKQELIDLEWELFCLKN